MPTRTLQIKVKPGAKNSALQPMPDGSWRAELKSPPVDGKANAELVGLIAAHFGCRRSAVVIKAGASARTKRVTIETP